MSKEKNYGLVYKNWTYSCGITHPMINILIQRRENNEVISPLVRVVYARHL